MLGKLLVSANYYLNPYSFSMFITALLVTLLGIFVYISDRNLVSKSFLIMAVSSGIWQAGIGVTYLMRDTMLILSFYKVFVFLGTVMIAPSIYYFTTAIPGIIGGKEKICGGELCPSLYLLSHKSFDRLARKRCSRTLLGTICLIWSAVHPLPGFLFCPDYPFTAVVFRLR